MTSGDTVRDRLTQAARANLDAGTADAWLAMLSPGTRLKAVTGPAPGRGRGFRLLRQRGDGAGREGEAAAVGWLGGAPVLPSGAVWPSWAGRGPLAHVATLECARLRPALPESLIEARFPASGWLSFFYFDGSADGGAEVVGALFPGTAEGARVIYTPQDRGAEAVPSAGVALYRKVDVCAEPVLTWATWEHPRLHGGGRPAAGWDAVLAVADQIRQESRAPAHQIGGNPDPVQGPVEAEVAYGELSGAGKQKPAWSDPAVIAAADGWLLLGQFDTDNQAGFMWGDCGVLYYLIRPADLAAGRFDQTAFTWQCG